MSNVAPHIYILAGDDHNGALRSLVRDVGSKPGVTVLRPEKDVPLDQTISRIKPPASIILAAHGGEDGTFTWHKDNQQSYGRLFEALPRKGVEMVFVTSCYGGSAIYNADRLPKGTLLYTAVGTKTLNYDDNDDFLTSLKTMDPARVMIAAVGAVNPSSTVIRNTWRNIFRGDSITTKESEILPYNIAIGGTPPVLIHPDDEIRDLVDKARHGKLDKKTFLAAYRLTEELYNRNGSNTTIFDYVNSWMPESMHLPQYKFDVRHVAANMLRGKMPEGVNENRVAMALSIAWLETSGELDRRIEKARTHEPPPLPELPKLTIKLKAGYHLEGDLAIPDVRKKSASPIPPH